MNRLALGSKPSGYAFRWPDLPIASVLQPVAEFFDDRVGQNILGNAFDLSPGGRFVQPAIQVEFEEFTLADVSDSFIAHLLERAVDCLSLGVEHRGLQHHCNVSLHGSFDYKRSASAPRRCLKQTSPCHGNLYQINPSKNRLRIHHVSETHASPSTGSHRSAQCSHDNFCPRRPK